MTRLVSPFVLAVSLVLPAAAGAAATAKSPVAVLPFKNLGGDPGLEWLGNGIAETMISDLRKSGKVTLVERDQVNVALNELLSRQPGTERVEAEADAARLGRMVGAKTVVVGGYQQAGKQLRINARFVEVETGVILDSVKATGSMSDVFAVQDQVVAKLLGVAPKAVAKRPKPKAAPKQVEAYRLYAMSLVTLSDAQQQSYLKQALEIDPGFTYAGEALDQLEDRLASYARTAEKALDERHKSMRAKLLDPSTPDPDRTQLALSLMNELVQRRRFRIAAEEAKRIYDMKFPVAVNADPHEWASHNLVLTHKFLKRDDLALQYAERHLQEFPGGPTYTGVEVMAKEILERRRQIPVEIAKRQAEHAKIDNDLAERRKRTPPPAPVDLARIALGKCTSGRYNFIPREVESDCKAYLDEFGEVPEATTEIAHARYRRALALYESGRFREAIEEIERLEADAPQFVTDMSVRMATSFWIVE